VAKKKTIAVVVPATGTALVQLLGSPRAVHKIGGSGGSIMHEGCVTLVTGRSYATATGMIEADEIYYVDAGTAARVRPRLGEADKVAWLDNATGYECIMLRATDGGYLSGYVGVPHGHPLWGWKYEAIPADLGIEVHGGLTYARLCEDGPTPKLHLADEARRICHVPRGGPRHRPSKHTTNYRVHDTLAWWFGFDCDHAYDVVPDARRDRHERFLAAEVGGEYRDDGYVHREVLNLAAQLRAIADGDPVPPRDGPPLPPISLDPGV
jgi:hypothetical protein